MYQLQSLKIPHLQPLLLGILVLNWLHICQWMAFFSLIVHNLKTKKAKDETRTVQDHKSGVDLCFHLNVMTTLFKRYEICSFVMAMFTKFIFPTILLETFACPDE